MKDQQPRYSRLRYTATGALAALAAVGAIAGTVALAANPRTKPHPNAGAISAPTTKTPTTKTPTGPAPVKTQTSQPPVNQQPFLTAIQQLVDDGTISATEGQTVEREIQAGRVDTDTLASSGFNQAQLQAVQQALGSAKQALAATAQRAPKAGSRKG
jgi:hypothetical protein